MTHYVDGFVVPVPKAKLAAYRRDRDRINAKVMADPRLAAMMDPKSMPFDGKRMFWSGFKGMLEL